MRFFIFALVVIFSTLSAKDHGITYLDLGGYERSFSVEIGEEKAKLLKEKALENKDFKEAFNILNKNIRQAEGGHSAHPDYLLVMDKLKSSDTIYGNWIGMSMHTLMLKKYREKKHLQKYGLHFTKELIKQNYCAAYLMKGVFHGVAKDKKTKQIEIWKRGKENNCIGTEFEKMHLTLKSRKKS